MSKNIRTATVTYYNEYNYGAVLQTYALQKFLHSLGIDNKIVDYSERSTKILEKISCGKLRFALYAVKRNLKLLVNYRSIINKRARFNAFVNDNLMLTDHYDSVENLIITPPEVDLLIAGSDQIWNLSSKLRKDFFLMFGGDSVVRISYAASLGRYDFSLEQKRVLICAVSKFDYVSVRESEAVTYLNETGNINAELLVDPTLLLNDTEWKEIAISPNIKEKYILCYPLLYHTDIDGALKKLKKELDIKVVAISPDGTKCCYADITVKDSGPAEFLGWVANAEYVVTSSFHGTVFSLLFKKPFVSYNNAANSGRISNLLDLVGLSNRFNPADVPSKELTIPYDRVFEIVNKEREKSKSFFIKIVEEMK
ncbi:MAG: polysaccharide pyruvyl transferase family protein [Oscillospiraceae bacterium]|jgi:hypothetical protein|nr:polysaccharide pyruvyl transferase family protein [Oscillospiraceae bacterium]